MSQSTIRRIGGGKRDGMCLMRGFYFNHFL